MPQNSSIKQLIQNYCIWLYAIDASNNNILLSKNSLGLLKKVRPSKVKSKVLCSTKDGWQEQG